MHIYIIAIYHIYLDFKMEHKTTKYYTILNLKEYSLYFTIQHIHSAHMPDTGTGIDLKQTH